MLQLRTPAYFLTSLCQVKSFKRLAHQQVRVRFAPSPTGYLHLGGLRTALYNYLFARNQNGKFLLRIEDTDQTRLVPGAQERLIEDLQWAGIEIDEGPGFGGKHGPYIQSQRLDLYSTAVRQLLDNGSAYRCFCTERRLDLLRKEALRTRQIPRYDNKCRHLSALQINELLDKKSPFCIRFKLSDAEEEPLHDLIYGKVQHNVSENEGDPVVIKSDNYPTYHFANVVDDHMMRVTHVLRGVEWQISTTKHLLLYKAFGWQAPKFGHLPLLVNADGTKLSKRQGDIGISHFRDKGYLPNALVNYVISAGGGFEHQNAAKPKVLNLNELASQFDIGKVNAHPSRLNPDLLNDFNRLEIKRLLKDPHQAKQLIVQVQSMIKEAYPEESNLDLHEAHIQNVLKWATNRLTFVKDLTSSQLSFLWVKPSSFTLEKLTREQMSTLIADLQSTEFNKDSIKLALRDYAKREKLKFALLMKNMRSALSGLKEGPGVAEMMEILGKDAVLQRLKTTLQVEQDAETLKIENEAKT